LNIDNKISPRPIWRYNIWLQNPSVHLRNFNKQHLISAKLYKNNVAFMVSQTDKFQLNQLTQTTIAAAL